MLPSEGLAKSVAEDNRGRKLISKSADFSPSQRSSILRVSPLESFSSGVVSWASAQTIRNGLDLGKIISGRKLKLIQSIQRTLSNDLVFLLPTSHSDLLEVHKRLARPFVDEFNRTHNMEVEFVVNCYSNTHSGRNGALISPQLFMKLYGLNIWQLSSLRTICDRLNSAVLGKFCLIGGLDVL